jgi:hypothetical protein
MSTFDEDGYAEPGSVYFQLKARETLEQSGTDYVYDLDIRDYNLWVREKMPVIFVLFDASRRRAYWLHVQQFFKAEVHRQPEKGAKRVRIRIPKRQVVNSRAITKMRNIKHAALQQEEGSLG